MNLKSQSDFYVEQYQLFKNSQDFTTIFNKSISDLRKNTEVAFFVSQLKDILDQRNCFLLYHYDRCIGYEVCILKRGIIEGGFTYVLPDFRGKNLSFLLREAMWRHIKGKCNGVIKCLIMNNNLSSLASARKTAAKMKFDMIESSIYYANNIAVGKIFEIKL